MCPPFIHGLLLFLKCPRTFSKASTYAFLYFLHTRLHHLQHQELQTWCWPQHYTFDKSPPTLTYVCPASASVCSWLGTYGPHMVAITSNIHFCVSVTEFLNSLFVSTRSIWPLVCPSGNTQVCLWGNGVPVITSPFVSHITHMTSGHYCFSLFLSMLCHHQLHVLVLSSCVCIHIARYYH